MTKLDISRAWDGAMRRLSANKELVLVLGGVFFLVPQLAFSMFTPPVLDPAMMEAESVDPEQVADAFVAFARQYWWAMALLTLVQAVGAIAVLCVLGAADRPTVNEAMQRGVKLTPTQFAAELLSWAAIFAPLTLVSVLSSVAPMAAILSIPAVVVCVYIAAKFSLSAPVIAIENQANPLAALQRSWALTKRNSGRLVMFYTLIFIAFLIVSSVVSLVTGILLALASESLATTGDAIIGSLFSAGFAVLFLAIRTAILRQLSGAPASVSVPPTIPPKD